MLFEFYTLSFLNTICFPLQRHKDLCWTNSFCCIYILIVYRLHIYPTLYVVVVFLFFFLPLFLYTLENNIYKTKHNKMWQNFILFFPPSFNNYLLFLCYFSFQEKFITWLIFRYFTFLNKFIFQKMEKFLINYEKVGELF